MATTYAAYYNLVMADKAARVAESRRGSEMTNDSSKKTSERKENKSFMKKALNQLRATDVESTPSGIYTPIIKQGPLFSGLKPAETSQGPTPTYANLSQRERPLFSLSSKRNSRASMSSTSSTESKTKA